jgi:hypothetical protein
MEALWGPRRGGPAGPVSRPTDDGNNEVQEARQHSDGSAADLRQTIDAVRAELAAVESRLGHRVARLVAIQEEGLVSVRAELAEMRAAVDTANASAPVDAATISSELELLERWEEESDARLTALESTVGSEVQKLSDRLTAAFGTVEAGVVTPAEHSQLRADLQFHMVEQLGLVMQEVMRQIDARATVIETELNRRFEAAVTMEAFVALRTELREALTTNMASAQATLQQRAAMLDAGVADLKAQAARRLDEMATLVATEAAAAGERSANAALHRRFPPS